MQTHNPGEPVRRNEKAKVNHRAVYGERIGKSNSEYFRILSGKMQLLCHQLT